MRQNASMDGTKHRTKLSKRKKVEKFQENVEMFILSRHETPIAQEDMFSNSLSGIDLTN